MATRSKIRVLLNAERARLALALLDISRRELSRRLRVDHSTVARWLRGDRRPTADDVRRVAELLGVELRWLVGGDHD